MNAVSMDFQLNIIEMNLSPRKCEQMEEANAREEILLAWFYFVLSGNIFVLPWGPEDQSEDEKYIDGIWLILFLLFSK